MDIEIIQPRAVQALAPDDLVPPAPGTANAGDAAQFSTLMDGSGTPQPLTMQVPTPSGANTVVPTMGDKILSGLNNMSNDLRDTWDSLGKSIRPGMTVAEMMSAQMEMAKAAVQLNCTTKAVGLVKNATDQLTKLQ